MLPKNWLKLIQNLKIIIQENNISIDESNFESAINYIYSAQAGDVIYPRIIKQKLKTSMRDTYLLLMEFTSFDLLSTAYELYCHKCNMFQSYSILDSLEDLDDYPICESCGVDLDKNKDVLVVFKKC